MSSHSITIIPNFIKIGPLVQILKCDAHTHTHTHKPTFFFLREETRLIERRRIAWIRKRKSIRRRRKEERRGRNNKNVEDEGERRKRKWTMRRKEKGEMKTNCKCECERNAVNITNMMAADTSWSRVRIQLGAWTCVRSDLSILVMVQALRWSNQLFKVFHSLS